MAKLVLNPVYQVTLNPMHLNLLITNHEEPCQLCLTVELEEFQKSLLALLPPFPLRLPIPANFTKRSFFFI